MSHARLSILGITDSHGWLTGFDYLADAAAAPARGLDRISTLVSHIRGSGPNVVVFDVGDSIQGTPMTSLAAREAGGGHPVAKTLNHIGVDAACLGNHELDYGLDVLAGYADECDFPILAANFTGLPGVAASTLIELPTAELGVITVGVLGLSTPGSLVWNSEKLTGTVTACGIMECASTEVPLLRARGADIVIVLAHAGLGPSSTYGSALPWPENDVLRLMQEVPGIDAVMLGHTHVQLAGYAQCAATGTKVPYVQPAALGAQLGRIDMALERTGDTTTVIDSQVSCLDVEHIEADAAITALVEISHKKTRAYLDETVGSAGQPVAGWPVESGPSPAIDLITHIQAAHVERSLAGTSYAGLPVLATTAMGTLHRGLDEGAITRRDLYRVSRFDNAVRAVVMTTRELASYLEHNARYFGDADTPGYNLDSLGSATHAVDYIIERHGADGDRIRDLRIDGRTPDAGERFVIALSDYRASGGGGFPATAGNQPVYAGPDIRDLMAEWLATHSPVTLAQINRSSWRIR